MTITLIHPRPRLALGLLAGAVLVTAGAGGALAQTAAPAARAAAVKVTNQTKQAIVAVYTSAAGRNDWGDDMLGKAKLPPGKTLSLKLTGGDCTLDFSALLENGDSKQSKGVDLCAEAPAVQF